MSDTREVLKDLTWTCMVCGKRRPDDRISVFKRDIGPYYGLGVGGAHENIRYCNDRLQCIEGAKNKTSFKAVVLPREVKKHSTWGELLSALLGGFVILCLFLGALIVYMDHAERQEEEREERLISNG